LQAEAAKIPDDATHQELFAHHPADVECVATYPPTHLPIALDALGLPVVAEQFHRRPSEQFKLALIRSPLYWTVYSSFNDFAGRRYYGIELIARRQGRSTAPHRS
jgi:hypothetical protein